MRIFQHFFSDTVHPLSNIALLEKCISQLTVGLKEKHLKTMTIGIVQFCARDWSAGKFNLKINRSVKTP